MPSPVHVPKPFTLPAHLRRPQPVLLLDASASMQLGEPSRITLLWTAVQALRSPTIRWKTAVFNDDCRWLTSERQPTPDGMTNLAAAFQYVGQIKPTVVTLVTDGDPDQPDDALSAAVALACPVNILYVGDPEMTEAILFCQAVCQRTGGLYARDILTLQSRPTVTQTLQKMLGTGTPPKSAIVMGGTSAD